MYECYMQEKLENRGVDGGGDQRLVDCMGNVESGLRVDLCELGWWNFRSGGLVGLVHETVLNHHVNQFDPGILYEGSAPVQQVSWTRV